MASRTNHAHTQGPGAAAKMFSDIANAVARQSGRPSAFSLAMLAVVIWLVTGPLFNYSDTWQLVINTGTTIVTFLIVFLIQNTQNRDARAMHLKLDELLKGVKGARTQLVDLEEMSDAELAKLEEEFKALRARYEAKRLDRQAPNGDDLSRTRRQ